ncbi:MAG: TatD family hydrolase, partial [Bacilli bacterium]|nr:TatD family hydrolase [Bacilli bacterium]
DPNTSGVMHCYSSSKESMQQFLDLNMYISLAGPVTFKNARVPKEVAESVPLNRLLIETDSPYLAPVPFRGKTNEPKNVLFVAEEIARLRETTLTEIQTATYDNACRLFGIK